MNISVINNYTQDNNYEVNMKFSLNEVKSALNEVQTTLRWSVSIPNPPAVVGPFTDTLRIRIQTSELPERTEDNVQVELGGFTINYPGKTTKNGELTLGFMEGTDATVIQYFTKLANARWSADGNDTQGVQSISTNELKCDLVMNLLAPNDTVTQTYKLVGCLFSLRTNGSLGQTADPLNPQVTVTYDDFHVSAGNVNY